MRAEISGDSGEIYSLAGDYNAVETEMGTEIRLTSKNRGELHLYVNDAINWPGWLFSSLAGGNCSWFKWNAAYINNTGTARITITRVK